MNLFLIFMISIFALGFILNIAPKITRFTESRESRKSLKKYEYLLQELEGYEILRQLINAFGESYENVLIGPNGIFIVMKYSGRSANKLIHKQRIAKCNWEAAQIRETVRKKLGFRPLVRPILCFDRGLAGVGEKKSGVLLVNTSRLIDTVQSLKSQKFFDYREICSISKALCDETPSRRAFLPNFINWSLNE